MINVTKVWAHNGDNWYDAISDSIIPVNAWTHVTFTANEGEATVYINGEEKFSNGDYPNLFTTTDATFGLGVNFWDTPFKGLMDEVRIYNNQVLSAEEVSEYYVSVIEGEQGTEGTAQIETGNISGSNGQDDQSDNDENRLPDTATNPYNVLTFGLLLIVIGGCSLLIARRQNS